MELVIESNFSACCRDRTIYVLYLVCNDVIAVLLPAEPPSIRIPPSDQIAIVGATVQFQCTTRGRDVTVSWIYNSQPVTEHNNIRLAGEFFVRLATFAISDDDGSASVY